MISLKRAALLLGMAASVVFSLAAAHPASASTYTYTTLDEPAAGQAAGGTIARNINNVGQIAGYFLDSAGNIHGFVYTPGTGFTQLDDPAADYRTYAVGINDSGQITGTYFNGIGSLIHGFSYTPGSGFTTRDDSLGVQGTAASEINNAGQTVGTYHDNAGNGHGYLYTPGTGFATLDDPIQGVDGTIAEGINNAGQVVGYFGASDGHGLRGFLYTPGTGFTTFDNPAAIDNRTWVFGINDANQIVGYYNGNDGNYHGFLYKPGVGFSQLDDPAATGGTFPTGINNAGQIVGYYVDANGRHGFLATPSSNSLNITNLAATVTSAQTCTISWLTNKPATSLVEYGRTTAYGQSMSAVNLVTSHNLALTRLSPGTLYHYRVTSVDSASETAVSHDYTFVTSSPATSGGDSTFHYTITRQADSSYRVDCTWTYLLIGNGQSQTDLTNVKLVQASLGGASQPTSPAPLPSTIAAFFSPGQTLNFTIVFPASAGSPGARVRLGITLQAEALGFNFGPTSSFLNFRATLP